jgi:hypothetical protein
MNETISDRYVVALTDAPSWSFTLDCKACLVPEFTSIEKPVSIHRTTRCHPSRGVSRLVFLAFPVYRAPHRPC